MAVARAADWPVRDISKRLCVVWLERSAQVRGGPGLAWMISRTARLRASLGGDGPRQT